MSVPEDFAAMLDKVYAAMDEAQGETLPRPKVLIDDQKTVPLGMRFLLPANRLERRSTTDPQNQKARYSL